MTVYFDDIDGDSSVSHSPRGAVTAPNRSGVYRNFFKHVLDVVLILITAPFVVPVVLGLALLVARDGHNPFFWNVRIGKGGRTFKMLKLRTMVPDADCLLAGYLADNPEACREWDATQKLKRDPRITKLGCFLRKTSIDELPQLWNVLIGEMSLVGPRPMLPEQREMYPCTEYYHLRPGMTGLWQVSDRNKSAFSRRAYFDRKYSEELSFRSDFSLLMRTANVVLKGTGY